MANAILMPIIVVTTDAAYWLEGNNFLHSHSAQVNLVVLSHSLSCDSISNKQNRKELNKKAIMLGLSQY